MRNEILVISNYFTPEMGAASNRMTLFCSSLKDRGYHPIVICPIPNYPKAKVYKGYEKYLIKNEEINGLKLIRPRIYSSNSHNKIKRVFSMISFAFWLLLLIPYSVVKYSPNKIIVQSPPLFVGVVGVVLGKLFRKEVILNVSDLWPGSALELGVLSKGILYDILLVLEKYMYRFSDKILCQSKEISVHICSIICNKPQFLYRNLSSETAQIKKTDEKEGVRLIYAGLLGHAQGVLNIIQNVDFRKLNVFLDIYGEGYEKERILAHIEGNPHVKYKGVVNRKSLLQKYQDYNLALVPLSTPIYGAVPSKVYELINNHIPILYCGSGEAAKIITDYSVGVVVGSEDYKSMEEELKAIKSSKLALKEFRNNAVNCSLEVFNFNRQFDELINFIE
jgi:glycosyltransferase involved in cell wall biosynthesis